MLIGLFISLIIFFNSLNYFNSTLFFNLDPFELKLCSTTWTISMQAAWLNKACLVHMRL
jgi:hypothetical protein